MSKGDDRMIQQDLEATLEEFASLVDVEEELSPELRKKLLGVAREASSRKQVGWETTVFVACFVSIGINLLGTPLLSGSFLVASLLGACAYALGVNRLLRPAVS